METTENKQNNGSTTLKVIIGVLLLALIGLGAWTYSMQKENDTAVSTLTTEKSEIERELEKMSLEYEAEIAKGTEINAELIAARDRIEELRKQVSSLEPSVAALKNIRRELGIVKNEREVLRTRIAMLEKENENLVRKNDSTTIVLNEEITAGQQKSSRIDSLSTNLSKDRAKAAELNPTNFSLKGVIVRSSGKQIENDKARRVDDLKVCFTIPQNEFAPSGSTSFYLQVINPDNNVIGQRKVAYVGNENLTYSKVVQFNYTNKELSLCEMVGADEKEIKKGTYRVSLYSGSKRVSSSEVVLK